MIYAIAPAFSYCFSDKYSISRLNKRHNKPSRFWKPWRFLYST